MRLILLIEEAATMCGGYSALAKALGVQQPVVSQWLHEKRPCPLGQPGGASPAK